MPLFLLCIFFSIVLCKTSEFSLKGIILQRRKRERKCRVELVVSLVEFILWVEIRTRGLYRNTWISAYPFEILLLHQNLCFKFKEMKCIHKPFFSKKQKPVIAITYVQFTFPFFYRFNNNRISQVRIILSFDLFSRTWK